MVRSVIASDTLVVNLMMFWALTIAILPLPTALVAKAGHDPVTKVFYIGTLALTSAILAVLCWAIGRNRSIRDPDDKPDPAQAIGSTIGFLVALAISLIIPSTSYYPLLLPFVPGPIIHLLRRGQTKPRRARLSTGGHSGYRRSFVSGVVVPSVADTDGGRLQRSTTARPDRHLPSDPRSVTDTWAIWRSCLPR